MNVTNPELVLVRGINSDWLKENFSNLMILFKGRPQSVPKEDAFYIGLYLSAPESAITHIGIVNDVHRYKVNDKHIAAEFYLKAIIKLNKRINPGHTIRKHENWSLSRLGLNQIQMNNIVQHINSI